MAFTPLNALHAFIAVARRRSFGAAAKELGVSTSALSQSVRQLETRLGVALLIRTTRSVAVTDAGQRLLAQGGPSVDQALESLKTALVEPGEVAGRIRLSVPTVAVPLVLARLLPRFAERFPKVVVEVYCENRFVDVVAEGLDGGIRLTESIELDMVQIRLTEPYRLVVVGAPSYFERHGVPRKPKDLLRHACIGFRFRVTGVCYPWEFERDGKEWRVPVQGPVESNYSRLMHELACAGVGLAWAVEPLVIEDVRAGRLRVVLEPYSVSVPGLFLYFPNRAQVSAALRAFVDVARELTSEQQGDPDRSPSPAGRGVAVPPPRRTPG